jgi:hypothetical protein
VLLFSVARVSPKLCILFPNLGYAVRLLRLHVHAWPSIRHAAPYRCMLEIAVRFPLLAFSIPGFAPDEHRSSTQRNSGAIMSLLNRKSDVKNHLSVRHHKVNHLDHPLGQPDEQVIAPVEPGAIKANSSDFAEDFNLEHSSSGHSIASKDGLKLYIVPQPTLPPRSVQE